MPLILPGNVASATAAAYSVDNSCMFNGVDTYLSRTTSSATPTLATKATLSFWIKTLSPTNQYITYTNGGTSPYFYMQFPDSNGKLVILDYIGGGSSTDIVGTFVLRDPSAWMHVVYSYDSTPSTPSSSSIKIFINGVQTTALTGGSAYAAQNTATKLTAASVAHPIGVHANTSAQFLNAYLAEYMVVDGQALNADSFGEFDSDSPTIWKPKDISGITVGNQGYYLDFKDSSNLGNDVGGNNFDFTSNNIDATNQKTDTPTNNFATLNPLWRSSFDNDGTYSEGNCQRSFTSANSDRGYGFSTMGVTAGKYYWEIKIPTVARTKCGVGDATKIASFTGAFYSESTSYGMEVGTDGSISENGTTTDPFAASLSDDDIVMFALDMDNHRCWYGINGTWQDSGDPTSGATGTGDITTQISDQTHINTGEFIFPFVYKVSTSGQGDFQCNFGNPPFTLSSAVADGNGYGAFEYAPPSGFLALCTKNLGSDGG